MSSTIGDFMKVIVATIALLFASSVFAAELANAPATPIASSAKAADKAPAKAPAKAKSKKSANKVAPKKADISLDVKK
jgi:hypothetical protein